MITQEQQKQGAELMRTLVEKAWENAAFKDQLVKNPVETIEAVTGKKFHQNVKFVVEDQMNESFIYINIPAEPKMDELELSEEQLEQVSGGGTTSIPCVVVGTGLVVIGMIGAAYATGFDHGATVAENNK